MERKGKPRVIGGHKATGLMAYSKWLIANRYDKRLAISDKQNKIAGLPNTDDKF